MLFQPQAMAWTMESVNGLNMTYRSAVHLSTPIRHRPGHHWQRERHTDGLKGSIPSPHEKNAAPTSNPPPPPPNYVTEKDTSNTNARARNAELPRST